MSKIIRNFHADRGIKEQYTIDENGIRNGKSKTWFIDGTLETECEYVDGKINGYKIWYRNDGSILKRYNYDFDGRIFEIGFVPEVDVKQLFEKAGIKDGLEDITVNKLLEVMLMSKLRISTLEKSLSLEKEKNEQLEEELSLYQRGSLSILSSKNSKLKLHADDLVDPRKSTFT